MGRKHAKQILLLNDLEIGLLEHKSFDYYWSYGCFYALPDFAMVFDLFSKLENAWSDDDTASDAIDLTEISSSLAFDVQEEVNSLGLRVRNENGSIQKIRDFKIDNGQYEFKYD